MAHHVLPGFGLSSAIALSYFGLLIFIPLIFLIIYSMQLSFEQWWEQLSSVRVLLALRLTILTAFAAALINMLMGLIVAWILVRYEFYGKKIINYMIDLPFALPTAVAGIALTSLYAQNGWLGYYANFQIAYTPIGIIIALIFVGLPFSVRPIQPVLARIPKEIEEAGKTLAATPRQIVQYLILPQLFPAMLVGFSMSFARSLGEYGSVIFIAGNIPLLTETLPVVINSKLDQHETASAAIIAVLMLLLSLGMLWGIQAIQKRFFRITIE